MVTCLERKNLLALLFVVWFNGQNFKTIFFTLRVRRTKSNIVIFRKFDPEGPGIRKIRCPDLKGNFAFLCRGLGCVPLSKIPPGLSALNYQHQKDLVLI